MVGEDSGQGGCMRVERLRFFEPRPSLTLIVTVLPGSLGMWIGGGIGAMLGGVGT